MLYKVLRDFIKIIFERVINSYIQIIVEFRVNHWMWPLNAARITSCEGSSAVGWRGGGTWWYRDMSRVQTSHDRCEGGRWSDRVRWVITVILSYKSILFLHSIKPIYSNITMLLKRRCVLLTRNTREFRVVLRWRDYNELLNPGTSNLNNTHY